MIWWQILVYTLALVLGIFLGMLLMRRLFTKKSKAEFHNHFQVQLLTETNGDEEVKEQTGLVSKEEESSAREQVLQEVETAKEESGAEFYHGNVEVSVSPPVGVEQLKILQEYLAQMPDCRLLIVGGSHDVGPYFVLSLARSLNLLDKLQEIPIVEKVIKRGKKISIILK